MCLDFNCHEVIFFIDKVYHIPLTESTGQGGGKSSTEIEKKIKLEEKIITLKQTCVKSCILAHYKDIKLMSFLQGSIQRIDKFILGR